MKPNEADVLQDVQRALAEDVGSGDVTAALLPADLMVNAMIISREPMLVCGRPWVDCAFTTINPEIDIQWLVEEGTWLTKPETLCYIRGSARSILTGERTALNFLQTLSATATQTHQYIQRLKGYKTRLLDTRKTLPGLRLAQKYAVACAGGMNHRMGLYDAFLIKENHIKACGSVKNAILMARKLRSDLMLIVEVETLEQLREALDLKPDRILLDNFSQAKLVEAVAINQPKVCELEASGGFNLGNIETVAQTGLDYISVGAVTKSIQAIDLSLLIKDIL